MIKLMEIIQVGFFKMRHVTKVMSNSTQMQCKILESK